MENGFKRWLSGKKKFFLSLLAAGITVYGHSKGWDREVTSQVTWALMSGVGFESALDLAAIIRGKVGND